MPTKEEEKLLLSFSGDKTKLGLAEKVTCMIKWVASKFCCVRILSCRSGYPLV